MTQISNFFNRSSGNKIVPVFEGEELPFTRHLGALSVASRGDAAG
jgi:hypothetical protein